VKPVTVWRRSEVSSSIVIIFQNEMYLPVFIHTGTNTFSHLDKNVRFRFIDDGVNGIQPKSVKVVFRQPVERIVNEEVPNDPAVRPIEIDGFTPRRAMPIGEELRCVGA